MMMPEKKGEAIRDLALKYVIIKGILFVHLLKWNFGSNFRIDLNTIKIRNFGNANC